MNFRKIKKNAVVLGLCTFSSLSAFNYTISFTGSGASTTIDSVVVQNLTKSTQIKVPAGNVLNLTDQSSGVNDIFGEDNSLCVSPNPIQSEAEVSFYVPVAGVVTVDVLSTQGAKVASLSRSLAAGSNTFHLALSQGSYLVSVQGRGFSYSTKVVSVGKAASQAILTFPRVLQNDKASSSPRKVKDETIGTTTMTYATGDHLLYKAYSGSGTYCTIVTDVPADSKTTNFNFVDCTDADGNHYATVTIGRQTWMAENLKTTKYRTGEAISKVTDNAVWLNIYSGAYCNYNNDASYVSKYGRLYNGYASTDARNIAPVGWHVPTDAEWTMLSSYLSDKLSRLSNDVAKELASATDWTSSSRIEAVGCNQAKNNSSGFSAHSGGFRSGEDSGTFGYLGSDGYWWSSRTFGESSAYSLGMDYNSSVVIINTDYKTYGYSVRCVRD